MESSYIDFRQRRNFSQKMNATFEFIRQNFKDLFRSLILIAGAPVLIGSIFGSSFYSRMMQISLQANSNPDGMLEFLRSAGFWLGIFGLIIFMFLAFSTTIAVINNFILEYDSSRGGPIPVQKIWTRVSRTLPMYLGTTLLLALVLIAGYIVILIPIFTFAAIGPVGAFFGVLLCFVAIIFLLFKISLVYCVRAFESRGFFDSLRRSYFLTTDKWWSTFGLLLILGMIQSAITWVFSIPWYVLYVIQMLHNLHANSFQEPGASTGLLSQFLMLIFYLVNFLLYAIPTIGITFQYFNLVELKEASGLMSRIDQIGQTPGSSTTAHEDF